MYKSKIFDVLNIKTEEKLIKNSIIKCDELNNISEHDIYVSIDLSRFTLYDTVSYAYYQLCILLTNLTSNVDSADKTFFRNLSLFVIIASACPYLYTIGIVPPYLVAKSQ